MDRTTVAELPVFLDLDGCLVDSRDAIAASIDAALDEGGLTRLGRDQVDRYIGPPVTESFRDILRVRGEPLERADAYVNAFRRVYKTISLAKTTVQPGIAAALDDIASDYSLFVVTSKAREFAEPIVAATGLGRWIRAVFGPDLTAPEESKSVTLARAITRTGARSGIVVGDRRHDIEAGRTCALRTVGVTWGYGTRSELVDALADTIIERPDELSRALAEFVRHGT